MVGESSSDHHRNNNNNNNQYPTLFPILYENDEEMLQSRTVREIQIASNFAVLKSSSKCRRNSDDNDDSTNDIDTDTTTTTTPTLSNKRCKKDVDSKEYQLAIETAILVQKEIEQWEKSIAELEQLLHQQEGQHQQSSSSSSSSSSSPTSGSSSTIVLEETNSDVDKVIGNVVANEMNIPIAIQHLASPSSETRAVVIDHIND